MSTSHEKAVSFLELGRLYAEKTDFSKAIPQLIKAKDIFYSKKDLSNYCKPLNLLLRIYSEQKNKKKIKETQTELNRIIKDDSAKAPSSTYYFLALCSSYEEKYEEALELLEQGLSKALESDNKKDICRCISGLANVYYRLNRLEEALKQIYNLRIFFQTLDLPEIKASSTIINGIILREQGQTEDALNIFWQAYEEVKANKDIYLYVQLLFQIGLSYIKLNDQNMARIYLDLAQKIVDPNNLKTLSNAINRHLKKLGNNSSSQYDLVFNQSTGSATEQQRGSLNFKNQFILMDLLKIFLKNPGTVYSKEALVEQVWKQSYDPLIHDNKVYVTIKRLRQLIEPDSDKPKYIFRAKNGYYLNRSARISFQS